MSGSQRAMRVLTLNVGLMRVRFLGMTVFENPAGVEGRGASCPSRVRDLCAGAGADVVCLQECYEDGHRGLMRDALLADYPYLATSHYRTVMNSGLMTFSRHPILSFRRVPHSDACAYERALGDRSMLVSLIAPPRGATPFTVVNAHLSSGMPVETARMSQVRKTQIGDIRREAVRPSPGPVIVAGDFNCGPELGEGEYSEMERSGWADAWVAANGASAGGVTWDKGNPLNAGKPSLQGRSHRCDHVWVASAAGGFRVRSCRVVPGSPPLSDHYAVAADVRLGLPGDRGGGGGRPGGQRYRPP